ELEGGTTTFTGGGTISCNDVILEVIPNANGTVNFVNQDNTIPGYGQFGYASLTQIISDGGVEASKPRGRLKIQAHALNNRSGGILRALSGSELNLTSNLATSTGTITVAPGGTFSVSSSTVTAGTLYNDGFFRVGGSGSTVLTGLVGAGSVVLDSFG